ncbi:RidA family protein [Bradyrhizobium sp. CB1717]|uniref:RidA family protein n=1 Tax=Bradyrhizobium sp. CB1717 TaxID=3039154 RepID=UPI0024B235F0|nr:RidA family protein [Bradyrhizobium sp. CB1717]WFU25154.1 RidA family protein [Bradyrhizobium sp. CB1717]
MANRIVISPKGHTKPIARYSPAISVSISPGDRMVFISGQVSSDAAGETVSVGDPAGQARYVFEKIEHLLVEAGGIMEDIVSLVIYLTDMENFEAISEVRNKVLTEPPPSSTLVEVSRLAVTDHLVEISAIAVLPSERKS